MSVSVQIEKVGKRVVISRFVNDKLADQDKIDPTSKKSRASAAKTLGVSDEQLLEWLQTGGRYEIPEEKPVQSAVIVRGLEQQRENGRPVESVVAALHAKVPVDQVIDWESIEDTCCLDVDYHDIAPPDADHLHTAVLTRVQPRPIAWHFSRSGGLHLFYVRTAEFTAEELAAIAALRFRMIDATAKLELKKVARGPGGEPVHFASEQDTVGANTAWLHESTYDEDAVREWLDDHGMVMGQRHHASKCPIHPTTDPGNAYGNPVIPGESGVFCFHCEGNNRSLGSRRPGFATWGALLDHPSQGDVALMVRKMTHWGHARWIFTERYGLPESLARIAYFAACKAYHGPKDERLQKIFCPYTHTLVRIEDSWRQVDGYQFPKEIQPLLAQLPQGTSPAAVCLLQQGCDITEYGFPPLKIVHGFKQAGVHFPPPAVTRVGRFCPDLVRRGERFLPRYVPRNRNGVKRREEDWAWDRVEEVLPGIDRRFVKLALCAIGSGQETRLGMWPLVFVSGPSGAGKTSTARFAAGVLGASASDVLYQQDEVRYYASIRVGKQKGCCLLFNEILKEANRARKTTVENALGIFLTLSEHALSHVLNVGPQPMGPLPACFMSEPACPPELRSDVQLARRIRDYRIDGEKTRWKQTIPQTGLTIENLHLIRGASAEMAEACDTIMSEVIDEFFAAPVAMSFDAQCEKLKVPSVLDSPEFHDPTPALRDFFRQVCAAPPITNERLLKQYPGGFKQICKTDSDTDLSFVYSIFADGANPPEWCDSRKLKSVDWAAKLGVHDPVHLDLLTDGVSVFVRFRVGPYATPARVNEEIGSV